MARKNQVRKDEELRRSKRIAAQNARRNLQNDDEVTVPPTAPVQKKRPVPKRLNKDQERELLLKEVLRLHREKAKKDEQAQKEFLKALRKNNDDYEKEVIAAFRSRMSKPVFTCANCGKTYVTQGNLRNHVRSKHPQVPDLPECVVVLHRLALPQTPAPEEEEVVPPSPPHSVDPEDFDWDSYRPLFEFEPPSSISDEELSAPSPSPRPSPPSSPSVEVSAPSLPPPPALVQEEVSAPSLPPVPKPRRIPDLEEEISSTSYSDSDDEEEEEESATPAPVQSRVDQPSCSSQSTARGQKRKLCEMEEKPQLFRQLFGVTFSNYREQVTMDSSSESSSATSGEGDTPRKRRRRE